jgi:NarL family two-component system sensor histidine kinase LiaS
MRRRAWGLSARLTASYILVTLAVVVLVEALVLGFQVPSLVNSTQLQAQIDAAAKSYVRQLSQRYPRGLPAGVVLGDPGQPPNYGLARSSPDGTLAVPAVKGPISSGLAVTAVVAVAANGTVVGSSAPFRYPSGRPAASELPVPVAIAIASGAGRKSIKHGDLSTHYGSVLWTVERTGRAGIDTPAASAAGRVAYVYVQAPWSPRFISPVRAWDELGQLGETGVLLSGQYALIIAIVPVGLLFGLLASWRLVRRVRRLERATLAVADGDYTVTLPASDRDEIGRLEANFTAMTRQLGSALAAERERASGDGRAAERARIAREVHDAISQHLFGLRMIAAGMCRADPGNEQARTIERISEEALRDLRALLTELRPASLDGDGLAAALRQVCAAYHERLGITVDAAALDHVIVPAAVEHALLRITQEACTNAVRHGNADRLTVSMSRSEGQVELAVRDTGAGFDPAAPHAGSGLAHIRDRVAELGGTVAIESAPGSGTALTVRVPVP